MNLRTFRHETRDDYLETILLVTRDKGYCRAIQVAAELNVSKPSVSVELTKLMQDGLVELDEGKLIRLTDKGRELAELTYAKHCYFRKFLLDLGVDEERAEKEACAMEHAISADSFERIRRHYPLEEKAD